MSKEVWKDIPNYEGLYQVSDLGRVRSLDRTIICAGESPVRKIKGGVMSPDKTSCYDRIRLQKSGDIKRFSVHQLVAITFLGHSLDSGLVINHINFDKRDNRLENLEIVTVRENSNYQHIKTSSKHTGVHKHPQMKNKWVANIGLGQDKIYLGCLDSEEDASEYYWDALNCIEEGKRDKIKVKRRDKTSKYVGVHFHKKANKWAARIYYNKQARHLGLHESEEEAHKAYQKALKEKSKLTD